MSDQKQDKATPDSDTSAAEKARRREEHKRRVLDDAVADTFPASDPIAVEHPTTCEEEPERNDSKK